jgi:hypothetical protein
MDLLYISIICIIITTLFGAFLRRSIKDKCLKTWNNLTVHIRLKDASNVKGSLNVTNTGLKLTESHQGTLLYKSEFRLIHSLIYDTQQLNARQHKFRNKKIQNRLHPSFFRKLTRRFINIIKIIRDSSVEILLLLLGQAHNKGLSSTMKTQKTKQLGEEFTHLFDSAYEPLWESLLGQKVTLTWIGEEHFVTGILREYSSEFIELMSIQTTLSWFDKNSECDIICPRTNVILRHFEPAIH